MVSGPRLDGEANRKGTQLDLALKAKPNTPSLPNVHFGPSETRLSSARKRGHKDIQPKRSILVKNIHSSKTKRKITIGSGPVEIKRAHSLSNIQDGQPRDRKTDPTGRLLANGDRSARRIPSHSDSQQTSTVPVIQPRRSNLLLPGTPIRPKPGTKNLLKTHDLPQEAHGRERDKFNLLLRRYFTLERLVSVRNGADANSIQLPSIARVPAELGEVTPHAIPNNGVAGTPMVHPRLPPLPPSRKTGQDQGVNRGDACKELSTTNLLAAAARVPELRIPSHTSSKGPVQVPDTSSSPPEKTLNDNNNKRDSSPPPLVAGSKEPRPARTVEATTGDHHGMDGRVIRRMGNDLQQRLQSTRDVVPGGSQTPHNVEGVEGSTPTPSTTLDSPPIINPPHDGLQCGGGLHKQPRVDEIADSPRLVNLDPNEGIPPASLHKSRAHTGLPECISGPPVTHPPRRYRMVPISRDLLKTLKVARPIAGRLVRLPGEQQASGIRLSVQPPVSPNHRRNEPQLEQMEPDLPVPPTQAAHQISPSSSDVQGSRSTHSTPSPSRSLVHSSHDTGSENDAPARQPVPDGARPDVHELSALVLELDRDQFLTELWSRAYDHSIADLLLKAHRDSTRRQFSYCWKKFQVYLRANDSPNITKKVVLSFLENLFTIEKISTNTILVYRNAIKLPISRAFNISTEDVEFKLLSKSFFIKRPPVNNILPSWELDKVLCLIKTARFNTEPIAEKDALMATLFLIALASGNRVSEISALQRSKLAFSRNNQTVTIPVRKGFLFKNQRQNKKPPNIVIQALGSVRNPHPLCPVFHLRRYLRISTSDKGDDAMFINSNSGRRLTPPTISQLLCNFINESQPGVIPKAHDIRKIASSLAWVRGVSIADITDRGFWKTPNVFINKYLTPIRSDPGQCVALRSSL